MGLLPLALLVAAGRALAFYLASRFGARIGKEAPAVASNAWYAYLPQAGVTLGLVYLAAGALPELAAPIERAGMAVVALHLILGPVLLGVALRRAGELPAVASPEEHEASKAPKSEAPKAEAPRVEPPPEPEAIVLVPPTAAALAERLGRPELIEPAEAVRAALEQAGLDFVDREVRPRAADALAYADGIFEAPEDDESMVMAIHRRLPKERPELVDDWVPEVQRLEQTLRSKVHDLPVAVFVPIDAALLELHPDDPVATRVRKLGLKIARVLRMNRGRMRKVPVRLLGRLACEARLADGAVALAGAWPRSYAAMLDQVRAVAVGENTPEEAHAQVEVIADRFTQLARRVLTNGAAEILDELATMLATAGSPQMPLSQLRFSRVEPQARARRQRVEREAAAWHRVAAAAFDTVRARTAVLAFGEVLGGILDKRVRGPLDTVGEQLVPVSGQIGNRLEAALEQLEGEAPDPARVVRAVALARSAYPKSERTRVRRARAKFRRAAQPHLLVSELARVIDGVPSELLLLAPGTLLDERGRVESVVTTPVDFGRRAEGVLLERLVPRLSEALEPVGDLVTSCDLRFDELVQVAIYGVEFAAQAGPLDQEQVGLFRSALQRAIAEAERFETLMSETLATAREAFEGEGARATDDLTAMLTADPGAARRVRSQVQATRRAISQRIRTLGEQLRTFGGWALRRIRGQGLLEGRVRSGRVRLDAAGMKAWVDQSRPTLRTDLPAVYQKLFSVHPVEDLRLAVAHRELIDRISRRVGDRERGGARVLVLGEHGSGRTSLLNALELRHQRQRVLRLDAAFHLRHEGLVSALAAELACRDDERGIVEVLRASPTVVFVDDLERHVAAAESGAKELERFLDIVVESQGNTAWVATTTEAGLQTLEVLASVSSAFSTRAVLAPLTPEEAQATIETRARLAGIPVSLPRPRSLTALLGGRASPERHYYRGLAQVAEGNVRGILLAHLRCLRAGDEDGLRALHPESISFPFLGQLPNQALAILALLLRFGPHDAQELARALRATESVVRLHSLNLEAAGLIHRPGGSLQELWYVPADIERFVTQDLARLGLLSRGAT